MLSRCPGEGGGLRGRGSQASPVGKGAGSTRGSEICATVAGERGPGAAGLLVKARCNSRLFPCPVYIFLPVAKSPAGAAMRPPALTSASTSVLAASGAGFLARPSRTQHLRAWLIACLQPRGGKAFPALATMAPSLPPSAPVIQTWRMRPSSSSVCQFVFARPELRLQACSPFVALSNLSNSLSLGCFFQPLHLP